MTSTVTNNVKAAALIALALAIGVMGIYVARIHEEVKRRPLYLVRDSVGLAYTQARGDGITHNQLDLFRDAGATTASPR